MLSKSGQDKLGYLIGLSGLIIVVSTVFAWYRLQPPRYDSQTLCLLDTEGHRTTVLVDKTDPFSDPKVVEDAIEEAKRSLPLYGRLTIHVLDGSNNIIGPPVFDLCNPGHGDQLSSVYRNPKHVRERYEQQFEEPLDKILDDLKQPSEGNQSPIAEALVETVFNRFAGLPPKTHEIILVSDLLENSKLGSAYKTNLSLDEAKSLVPPWLEKLPEHTSVTSVVVKRPRVRQLQYRAIENFWQPWLDAIEVDVKF
ncbi:MAG: hypothetical protein OEU92_11080 [Alphaproteobacteria bacterium]|nr:hypothetical protein [Alphaproteobacteria bacterium]